MTKILIIPSLVDETYCRVASEGLMNGIPIISTGYGNIKYLLSDCGIIIDPDDTIKWVDEISKLYNDQILYDEWSRKSKLRYSSISIDKNHNDFDQMILNITKSSKIFRIMILSPWCDQGLGIQSRNYKNILESNGFIVSIFAIKPYDFDHLELQKNPDEWKHHSIYYSNNDREHITDQEILDFVNKYSVGKCILPETCWYRVFQLAYLLKNMGVDCYAIPNIEIVRQDEIHKHEVFSKILCNNFLCQNIFTKYCFKNDYIGYGINDIDFKNKIWPDNQSNLVFICIGGRNAFTRKHVLEVCESFKIAYNTDKHIKLIVTIQKYLQNSIDAYRNLKFIDIIDYELTYSQIMDLYYNNHISIQVSKHEGLGIGFYESVLTGTPVITLKTPPHNEIILDEINGWTVDCNYSKMTDNDSSFFDSAHFDVNDLADKIIHISKNRNDIPLMVSKLKNDIESRLSYNVFCNRFINALVNN